MNGDSEGIQESSGLIRLSLRGWVFVKLRGEGECRRAASKFTLLLSIEAVSPWGGCFELANPNQRDRNAVCCWSAALLTRNTISMPAFWFVEIRLYHPLQNDRIDQVPI